MKTDWKGNEIPANEPPDTIIDVWEFEPGGEGYDTAIIRSYQEAISFVQDRIEQLMDQAEESDLRENGLKLTIKLKKIRLEDYQEACDSMEF